MQGMVFAVHKSHTAFLGRPLFTSDTIGMRCAVRRPKTDAHQDDIPRRQSPVWCTAVSGGGEVVLYEGSGTKCTHVVARHMEEEISVWGKNTGKTLVTAFWVWECADKGNLWPLHDPVSLASLQPFCPCIVLRRWHQTMSRVFCCAALPAFSISEDGCSCK